MNKEILDMAIEVLINSEGNKFKAIKDLRDSASISNDEAIEYINEALAAVGEPLIEESHDEAGKDAQHFDPLAFLKIKKTIIVAQESKKNVASSVLRGLVGDAILGPAGAVAGGVSGKSDNKTTFQVIYENGHQRTVTVKNNSLAFKNYCKYLDV